MAPIAIDTPRDSTSVPLKGQVAQQQQPLRRTPLQLTGILDHFVFEESTPAIGREYTTLDIKKDLFEAPESDARLRELAIISECERAPPPPPFFADLDPLRCPSSLSPRLRRPPQPGPHAKGAPGVHRPPLNSVGHSC